MAKVTEQEDRYWEDDQKLDAIFAADSQEEREAELESPYEGVDPYLDEH